MTEGVQSQLKKADFAKAEVPLQGEELAMFLTSEQFLILLFSVYGIKDLTAAFMGHTTSFLSVLLQSHTARFCEQ